MNKQDFKSAIIPVGLAVSVVFNISFAQRVSSAQSVQRDYEDLKDKSSIMAQTIENYSAQLDHNVEVIKQKDIHIKKLESQIPK